MIVALDHLVLTVRVVVITCQFYADVLGMEVVEFGNGRIPSIYIRDPDQNQFEISIYF